MGAPSLPFKVAAGSLNITVVQDTSLGTRGETAVGYDRSVYVKLREYDERVLLHEVLHVAVRTDEQRPLEHEQEERLVRRLTSVLWGMGWRWRGLEQTAVQVEEDRTALTQDRDALTARVLELEAALHAQRFHSGVIRSEDVPYTTKGWE